MSTTTSAKSVRHFRQILLWPVYLHPLDKGSTIRSHWQHLAADDGSSAVWREHEEEFGDPSEFQERHYNEFVTFLPPAQRFLYGQGLGKSVRRSYGESPIKVLRRSDIAKVRLVLEKCGAPIDLSIAHVDLYFFFDVDVALLNVEVFADGLSLEVAQEIMFRFGRAYPAHWEADGRGGHCPWSVQWIGLDGAVLCQSDFGKREKFLSFVCEHRSPAVAAHWEFLLAPAVLYQSDNKGPVRYRQLEYYRMPFMAFLAIEDLDRLTRADYIRLAIGSAPGESDALPYSTRYLKDFEARHCYDRYWGEGGGDRGTRFMGAGHTFVVTGDANDPLFVDSNGGILARFRHQNFLLYLVAHFQKAALRMFSDRLIAAVSRLDLTDARTSREFRSTIREALENFLRFEHRYWFHEISDQTQVRELFQLTRRHLDLDALYEEVRQELQDMGSYLELDAMRRQNESVVRLTVVTIFGLAGTVATGFLGMNLFSWTEEPVGWRAVAFFCVFVPVLLLTLYTVTKSQRLSEFLDSLSDESATFKEKLSSLLRVVRRS